MHKPLCLVGVGVFCLAVLSSSTGCQRGDGPVAQAPQEGCGQVQRGESMKPLLDAPDGPVGSEELLAQLRNTLANKSEDEIIQLLRTYVTSDQQGNIDNATVAFHAK